MTFGKKLKQIRLERGLSQDEFANMLGTSKQVISRYETEQRTPKLTVAQDYAKKLGLPLNYLIDDSYDNVEDCNPITTVDKIIALLGQRNKTQKELTDYLGIERSVFTTWKTGKSKSYTKYLPRIADFLNTTVEYLSNDNDEESPDEDLIILNRAAKKLTPENRKKVIDMINVLFQEDFDD